jgi:adenylate kinase family enzyme
MAGDTVLRARIAAGGDAPETLSYSLLDKEIRARPGKYPSVVLDGFPRYARQMDRLIRALGQHPDAAIVLEAPTPLLVHRIRSRLICAECGAIYGDAVPPLAQGRCDFCDGRLRHRDEDHDPTAIAERHKVWDREGADIVERLEQLCPVVPIDASRSPVDVLESVGQLGAQITGSATTGGSS